MARTPEAFENSSDWMRSVRGRKPDFAGVEATRDKLAKFLQPTPLVPSAALSSLLDADVWIKVETPTPTASFKLRGALNHIVKAIDETSCEIAVTSSTGNHGQAVAYAARLAGISAHIFLPEENNETKNRMIRLFGGRIHEVGHDIDAAKQAAREFAESRNATFVDDGESVDVIEGAATAGYEIGQDLQNIDRVYVPMGSGTLATGVGLGLKSLQEHAEVIAVQSEGSPAMTESFKAKRPLERPIDTFADCIVCRLPALQALAGIIDWVDDCRLVSDDLLLKSMHSMLIWGHILVEPGAAAPLARAYLDRPEISRKRVVLFASGANVGTEMIQRALAKPPLEAD